MARATTLLTITRLTSCLAKLQTMLIKKSEDMEVKGNVTARTALQQAAETVTQAWMQIFEQQPTRFGFSEHWKMQDGIVRIRIKRRNLCPENDIEEIKNAIFWSREIENDMKRVKGRAKERQEEDAALLEQ
ncbi:hypothetical protein Plhal304r1_c021g0073911 [Plasmopara halstedii]